MQANFISDVKSSLVLSITKDNDTLTEFGDDDALLSVASGAIEVKSNADSRGSSGPLHTRISEQSLKPSELREQISTERRPLDYETSPRVSTEEQDFESLGLVGRDIQIASLKACFDRISASQTENESSPTKERNKGHKELLLIAGESGAGKSSICKVLEKQMIATKSGVFVEGKFNMYTSDEPYSGIAKALSAMCKMASSDKSSESGLQQKIVSSLHGDDTRLLIYLVPELANLMPDQNSTNSYTSEHFEAQEVENGVERLRYAFRLLIRVFCGHFAPMVLFFDDLQWADVSSLQMIDYLMSDTENESPLLIIGTYRSDEADENSLLFNKILVLKDKSSVDGYRVTEVDVPPFQSEDTLAAIKSFMKSVDESDAKLLADLCIKRTLGNPYFIVEFLKLLYKEGLIEHSDDSKMWTWDLARIEDATMSTANVVILLQDRMRRLTRQAQVFLRCAAHIGSTFSTTALGLIWKTHGINMSMGAQGTFSELMAMVVEDNYIEEHCPGKFRWVHDKVQEAALFLLGDANASFKLDIGTTLYYSLDSDQLEQHLFTVVDLINKGNRKKRQEFAAVNLRAAEKAMGLSAFQSAASYAAHGISLLQEDGWSTGWMGDRQIKLKLYTSGAEAEQILGNVETAERYIEEVLKQDNFTVLETLPLKMVKGKMMCTMQLRHRDAIDYCIAALNELDFKLIASRRLAPFKACYAVSKIVKKLKRLPKSFMKDLGAISDARQKGILALIGLLRDAAYSGKEPMLCVLADCKTIEMTLKHGVSEYSGASFAAVGAAVMHFQQDYETTQHLMELALAIQEIAGRSGKGKTIQLANMNGFAWTTSLNCIDSMATGYNVALQMGEIVPANWNLLYERIVLPFYLGMPLDRILRECPRVLARIQEAAQRACELVFRAFYQMILNLSDPSSIHTTRLEGMILDHSKHNSDNAMFVGSIHLVEGDLLLFFSDFEGASQRAIDKGDLYSKLCPSLCLNMCETFHRAIALFDAAQRTKQRKYRAAAIKLRKRIVGWERSGNPNCMHMLLLLDAEFAVLHGQADIAKAKYAEAITVAKNHGYLQYEALFNERYAKFLLDQLSLAEKAEIRRIDAIDAYKKWGAHAKVAQLMGVLKDPSGKEFLAGKDVRDDSKAKFRREF